MSGLIRRLLTVIGVVALWVPMASPGAFPAYAAPAPGTVARPSPAPGGGAPPVTPGQGNCGSNAGFGAFTIVVCVAQTPMSNGNIDNEVYGQVTLDAALPDPACTIQPGLADLNGTAIDVPPPGALYCQNQIGTVPVGPVFSDQSSLAGVQGFVCVGEVNAAVNSRLPSSPGPNVGHPGGGQACATHAPPGQIPRVRGPQ